MSTDSSAIRSTLVETLRELEVDVPEPRLEQFAHGRADLPIDDLALDSVLRMELLVAVELAHGVVVPPAAFAHLDTLGALADQAATQAPAADGDRPPPGPSPAETRPAADAMPPVVAVVRRALRGARAVGHVHQLCMCLEHRLAPPELHTLWQWQQGGQLQPAAADARHAEALANWLTGTAARLGLDTGHAPQPFRRERLAPAVWHFVGPGEPDHKTLIVCFTPKGSRRMMIPHASLLQRIDATRHDVLLLADPWETCFRKDVPGLGADVWAVIDWVAAQINALGYRRVRTLGCSAGSYPAILAAYRLRAELGLSIAGRLPTWGHLATIVGIVRGVWRASRLDHQPRLVMAFAARTDRDRRYARRIGRLTQAGSLAADVEGNGVGHRGHMVLNPLQDIGQLQAFFDATLLAPVDADTLPGPGETRTVRYTT